MLRTVLPFLTKKVKSLVFLGDFVDRGKKSFSCLFYAMILSLTWPDRVILLKGNHEDTRLNMSFGLFRQLQEYYPEDFLIIPGILDEIYNNLSLIAITPAKSICLHGGVPVNTELLTLPDLKKIKKPHNLYSLGSEEGEASLELRWNDPLKGEITETTGDRSYHGYFYFTESHVDKFLNCTGEKISSYARIIRGHEHERGDFEILFNGKLLHILSAPINKTKSLNAWVIYENIKHQIFLCDRDFTEKKEIESS